jgi:hypothetical protein
VYVSVKTIEVAAIKPRRENVWLGVELFVVSIIKQ